MHNMLTTKKENILKQDFVFFEDLFNTYYCPLLAFANKYTNDRQASEDIVQDVFMALWIKRGSIDFSVPVKAYLYKATYNKSINYLNSLQANLNIDEENIKLQLQQKIISCDLDESLLIKELSEEIIFCVDKLPEQCRKVFLLSRGKGLKNKEIALQLNISEKTVEGHISKALAELRIHLKKLKLIPAVWYILFQCIRLS